MYIPLSLSSLGLLTSRMCILISVIKLGKFSAIIFSNILSDSSSLSLPSGSFIMSMVHMPRGSVHFSSPFSSVI